MSASATQIDADWDTYPVKNHKSQACMQHGVGTHMHLTGATLIPYARLADMFEE